MLFKVSSLFLQAIATGLISQGESWDCVTCDRVTATVAQMTFKLSIPNLFYLRQTLFKRVFKNNCVTF